LVIVTSLCHDGIAQSKFPPEKGKKSDSLVVGAKIYYKLSKETLRDSIYMFPSFQDGRVTFATGFSLEEKFRLNYNFYSGQMVLIINDGDTTEMVRLREVMLVSIGNHLFYHDNKVGYIEIVHQSPVALRRLSSWAGTSESDIYYAKEKHYYFLDKENKSYLASATSIQKLFPDHRKKINAYIDENRIDFEKQSDLIKLLKFCDDLTKENQNQVLKDCLINTYIFSCGSLLPLSSFQIVFPIVFCLRS
jgi:ribosomal protein L19